MGSISQTRRNLNKHALRFLQGKMLEMNFSPDIVKLTCTQIRRPGAICPAQDVRRIGFVALGRLRSGRGTAWEADRLTTGRTWSELCKWPTRRTLTTGTETGSCWRRKKDLNSFWKKKSSVSRKSNGYWKEEVWSCLSAFIFCTRKSRIRMDRNIPFLSTFNVRGHVDSSKMTKNGTTSVRADKEKATPIMALSYSKINLQKVYFWARQLRSFSPIAIEWWCGLLPESFVWTISTPARRPFVPWRFIQLLVNSSGRIRAYR